MIDCLPHTRIPRFVRVQAQQIQTNLSIRVNREDPGTRHVHAAVAQRVGEPVAKARVEGTFAARGKEGEDVAEAGHLEDLGLAEVDLAAEGGDGAVGGHDDGALGEAVAFLRDAGEVVASGVGLSDGAGGQVEDVVAVGDDVGVELGDAEVCPVAAEHVEDVAEGVGSAREELVRPKDKRC